MSVNKPITVLVLLALTSIGCQVNGSDPYALWDTYKHPDGLYSFRYLPSVWEFASPADAHSPVLVVDPRSDYLVFTGKEDEVPARYYFTVRKVQAFHPEAEKFRWIYMDFFDLEEDELISADGRIGLWLRGHKPGVWMNSVYYQSKTGTTIALDLFGRESLDTHDLQLMLKSYESKEE